MIYFYLRENPEKISKYLSKDASDPTLKKEKPEPNKRLPVCLAAWEDSLSLLKKVTNNIMKPGALKNFDPENLNWDDEKDEFTDAAE